MYRPKPKSEFENGFSGASTSAFDPIGSDEPHFPKSLYLLKPLFSSYALNPVAPEAQASVAVPEGLDLDAWIVPEAKPVVHVMQYENTDDKKKKNKKGKAKADGGNYTTKKSKKKNMKEELVPMTQEDIDVAEERAKVINRTFTRS